MRLIVEARVEDGEACATDATNIAVAERSDRSFADLGLTLAEGSCLARRGSIASCAGADDRMAEEPNGLPPLWLDAGAQGRPIDGATNRVWEGRRAESEDLGMQLCGRARATAPVFKPAVQGPSSASDTEIGIPAGQVGRLSTVPSGH
jgi:hypothetical protein